MSGNIAATRGAATGRPLDILLWCVHAFVALTAHLFILHAPPTTPGVLFLMSDFVVWGRR